MKNLTLIIPAKFEGESLPQVLKELELFKCEKLIVLDKEDIKTISAIKQISGINILFQNKRGYGAALIEGIENCTTDFFCIFNADGSFNPKELICMYKEIEMCDFVFGSRYQANARSEDDTIITKIGNFIFTKIGQIFFNLPITDILYTYIMGKTAKAKLLNLTMLDFSYCVEFPIKAHKSQMQLKSVPSFERKRIAGKKKVNAIKDGFIILKSLFFLYFSK
jgi:glycosyltransferase involved in cell wall biosynthesis